ncbi:MAG: CHAT domain-containing protein [Saprospirales bacterium]|nr:CHAT domain-containing protein [Saprospirales bacterium]
MRFACTQGAFLYTLPDMGSLAAAIQRFGNYFREADASLSDPAGYFAAAYALYDALVPDEAKALAGRYARLIVIPDGPLANLPFEALLTEPLFGKNFGKASYLIKKLAVQYSWSAELLWRPAPEKRGGAIVQFDPQFSKGERGLVPLVQGKKETASLAKLRRLAGSAAVLAEFQRWAPKSLLLHLSTHASAGVRAASPGWSLLDPAPCPPAIRPAATHRAGGIERLRDQLGPNRRWRASSPAASSPGPTA